MTQPGDGRSRATAVSDGGDGRERLLLAFLDRHDAECPLCGYSLHKLTRPECPECRHELVLTVGVRQVGFGWFLATIAPCIFSGISAIFLAVPLVISPLIGGGMPPWFLYATDAFGVASGLAAVVLILRRTAFLKLPRAAQRAWATASWAVHVAALLGLMLVIFS